jgi:CHAD domain-containing protein
VHGELKTVLKHLVLRQTHKLLKKGRRLHPRHASSRRLHKLRIRGKNLRYLIDSFPMLLRNDAIRSMRKRLGKLQDILGQHQDSVMTATYLTTLRNNAPHNNAKDNDNNDKSNDEQLRARDTASAFDHWIEMAQRQQLLARLQYHNALLKLARASKQLPS